MVGYQNASKVNQLYSENIELQKKIAKCQNSTINKSKQVSALLGSQMKCQTTLEKVRKTLNHLSSFQWKGIPQQQHNHFTMNCITIIKVYKAQRSK